MDNQKMFTQYKWVLKVLSSCVSVEQIVSSEKLFEIFVKNWKTSMTKNTLSILTKDFENERKNYLGNVAKKGKSNKKKTTKYIE
jgi:hypothetical protein